MNGRSGLSGNGRWTCRQILNGLLAACFVMTFAGQPALAADAGTPPPLAGFDDWAREARVSWGIPGFAVAVVKDGEAVFAEGYGLRNIEKGLPFTPDTVSHIGSTTKAFVTMALAMLVDEGLLGWDDKVTRHLPGFSVKDPWVTRELTVRDILTHRGGFKNHDMLWARGMPRKESVRRMAHIDQASSMRTTWDYNNLGYLLAGEIIEACSGMPMEDFIRSRILMPLGMHATTMRWANTKDLDMLTDAHYRLGADGAVKVPYSNIDASGGAGVMNSTVNDMSKWLAFLLSGGVLDGERLVSEKNFNEIFSPQSIVNVPIYPAIGLTDAHFVNYGLAWFLQDFEGRKLAMHTGSIGGLNAIVAIMPEEQLGLVGLFNRQTSELRHAVMYEILDRFTDGDSGRDWSGDIRKLYTDAWAEAAGKQRQLAESRIPGTRPSLPLKEYTGRFTHAVEGDVVVEQDGDAGLVVKLEPKLVFDARHFHLDTFELRSPDLPAEVARAGAATFQVGAAGKVVSVSLNGTVFRASGTGVRQ